MHGASIGAAARANAHGRGGQASRPTGGRSPAASAFTGRRTIAASVGARRGSPARPGAMPGRQAPSPGEPANPSGGGPAAMAGAPSASSRGNADTCMPVPSNSAARPAKATLAAQPLHGRPFSRNLGTAPQGTPAAPKGKGAHTPVPAAPPLRARTGTLVASAPGALQRVGRPRSRAPTLKSPPHCVGRGLPQQAQTDAGRSHTPLRTPSPKCAPSTTSANATATATAAARASEAAASATPRASPFRRPR